MTGSDKTKRHHKTCTHAKYRMTCDQFDDLWETADGRCQVCGQLYRYTGGGRLLIDHEKRLGYWAVRGLLCISCNSRLGFRDQGRDYGLEGPEVDAYLANPWYKTLPFADRIEPETEEQYPQLDPATATELLCAAAKEAEDARQLNLSDRHELRAQLVSMIRWAHHSGVRQVDMIEVAGYGLTRNLIYSALNERRVQPRIPTAVVAEEE